MDLSWKLDSHACTRAAALAAVCVVALFASATQARGAIPQGNLLLNPGGELGAAVSDETSHFCPSGWTCVTNYSNGTLVHYGTTSFPSIAESERIAGGNNFFSGGPDNSRSVTSQYVDLGAAQAEIDAGAVQATFSGCLGGWQTQDDIMLIQLFFFTGPNGTGAQITGLAASGPNAAARGNKTKLLPVSTAVAVPSLARSALFELRAERVSPGSYNDAYADNPSLTLGPAPGPAPAVSPCSVPAAGGGGSGGNGSGSGGGGSDKGTKGVLTFGKAIVGSDGKARVPVRCNTTQVSRCKGTLSVSLVKATQSAASKKKVKLGSARYSVASLKRRTIKVRLRRSDARTLAGLSNKRLAKRRLKLRATTTIGTAKLKQTSLLVVKRRG